jgi:hypothetical protein
MPTIVNTYSQENPIGQAISEAAKSFFGDRLTPALKRSELEKNNIENQANAFKNSNMTSLTSAIQRLGAEAAARDYGVQASIVGSGYKPQDYADLNRMATTINPANTLMGETVARAGVAAGGSMANTPMGFDVDQRNQISMNNADNATSRANNAATVAQQRYEFENKPIDAMMNGAPAFVPQGQAVGMGAQPLVKNGLSVTTNPDGTVSINQGGTGNGKPAEWQAKYALSAANLTEPVARVTAQLNNGVVPTTKDYLAFTYLMQNPGLAPAGVQVMSPEAQSLFQDMRPIVANYLFTLSGQAATEAEVNRTMMTLLPVPGEAPQVTQQKTQQINTMLRGVSGLAGSLGPVANPGGNAAPPPAPTPNAPPAPMASAPTQVEEWGRDAQGNLVRVK